MHFKRFIKKRYVATEAAQALTASGKPFVKHHFQLGWIVIQDVKCLQTCLETLSLIRLPVVVRSLLNLLSRLIERTLVGKRTASISSSDVLKYMALHLNRFQYQCRRRY